MRPGAAQDSGTRRQGEGEVSEKPVFSAGVDGPGATGPATALPWAELIALLLPLLRRLLPV